MKRIALALFLVTVGCGKSDSKKSDDPAPAATDHADHADRADQGSADGEHHHGRGKMNDEQRRKRLEELRAKLDTNGDGKLSPDELAKADGRMKFDDPAALDTNHDGDISLDELEAGMKARREQMRGAHGGGDDNGGGGSGGAGSAN